MKKILVYCMLIFLMISLPGISIFNSNNQPKNFPSKINDFDPTVNLSIDVIIKRVRTIDIEINNPPSFFVKVKCEGGEWKSKTFSGFDVMNLGTAHFDIPDDEENIDIIIEVFKNGIQADVSNESKNLRIIYDVIEGTWRGDDYLHDVNGYGHASGTEDGKYDENDCEIWFDILEDDYDGDGLTYWEEVNIYHTSPLENDAGRDDDGDGLPIEWEDKYGYNPFSYDEHSKLDPDEDGLQNDEEYMMESWFSDPFRQDIYIENDYMEEYNGITPIMPEESIQMQYSAFTKHNIMLFIDAGLTEESEKIPYQDIGWNEIKELYEKYFLHNNENNPRKGVFHYALIIHSFRDFGRGVGGFNFKRDAFAVCSAYIQRWRPWKEGIILGHGGSYMHELGHQLGLSHLKVFPWQPLYWLSWNYKSCMNYRYNFKIVDYSDGSHGFMDRDEWGNLNLQRFDE
ncbi:MAG TPA: hypothetical protein ENI33_00440 [Thermoplasmatales archaeon]|nr:hypothetical protein [Thermoplasmatales archaeon]